MLECSVLLYIFRYDMQ